MTGTMTTGFQREEIQRRIAELGDWFQNIELNGVQTAPHHFLGDYPTCKWRAFAHAIPADLTRQRRCSTSAAMRDFIRSK